MTVTVPVTTMPVMTVPYDGSGVFPDINAPVGSPAGRIAYI